MKVWCACDLGRMICYCLRSTMYLQYSGTQAVDVYSVPGSRYGDCCDVVACAWGGVFVCALWCAVVHC